MLAGLIIFSLVSAIAILGLLFSRSVDTQTEINASTEQVWEILSEFHTYHSWNPFIIAVSGPAEAGNNISVTIKLPIGLKMNFRLLLKELSPPDEMAWTGTTLAPNILDGHHYFKIEPLSDHKVRFSQGESYRGILLFFCWPFIQWSVTRSFTEMNLALKQRAENT